MKQRWYLRSTADQDTHLDELQGDGSVIGACGLTFRPILFHSGRTKSLALPGKPADPTKSAWFVQASGTVITIPTRRNQQARVTT
jgi:hypothetical protein